MERRLDLGSFLLPATLRAHLITTKPCRRDYVSKVDQVARCLSWQSAGTVKERPLVRVPVVPRFFPPLRYLVASVTSWLGPRASKSACLVGSSVVPSRFGDESYQAAGGCRRSTK